MVDDDDDDDDDIVVVIFIVVIPGLKALMNGVVVASRTRQRDDNVFVMVVDFIRLLYLCRTMKTAEECYSLSEEKDDVY